MQRGNFLFSDEYILLGVLRSFPNPAGIYLLKVNNRNTRARCEICLKLKLKTPKERQWRRSSIFTINVEHISHLVFLLLTLNI